MTDFTLLKVPANICETPTYVYSRGKKKPVLPAPLLRLPNEVIAELFKACPLLDRLASALTCKQLLSMAPMPGVLNLNTHTDSNLIRHDPSLPFLVIGRPERGFRRFLTPPHNHKFEYQYYRCTCVRGNCQDYKHEEFSQEFCTWRIPSYMRYDIFRCIASRSAFLNGTVASLFVGNQNGWVTMVKEKAKYLVEEFVWEARHAGFVTLKYRKKAIS
jgi:hypothetical protein